MRCKMTLKMMSSEREKTVSLIFVPTPGCDENAKAWGEAAPSGELRLNFVSLDAAGELKIGGEYTLELSPA